MFAVFAAFGTIVWLAYEHGSPGSPGGEPPLVKAPATAIKLAPDESQQDVAEGGEVLDMLSDTPPAEELERLLPPPEEPRAPVEQAAAPPAVADDVAELIQPLEEVLPVPEPQPAEAETAATPDPPPASEAEEPEEPEIAATTPEPTPEEAEAALEALLAEVTEQAERSRETSQEPEPGDTAAAGSGAASSEVRPAVAPPASSPAPAPSFERPSGGVTAIARDQRRSSSGTGASGSQAGRSQIAAVDGPYRIQLAAVRDEADARRAWDLFQVDLGSVLSGLEPFIERADTANGVFYRVQIGPFASLQDAEALCDQLKQRNASCFVIRR